MTRIAFVSCAHPTHRPVQPAWDAIAAAQPDLLLLLGDNTYMSWDGRDWEIEKLQANYETQFAVPGFRKLLDTVPHLAIWDDHDFGWNDCVGSELTPERLAATRALFDQYPGVSAINTNKPHMYCSHDIGPVRVIMLDVRTHRTLSTDANPTVLGAVQEQWLWQQLADNPRPCTIVCSGSGIGRGAKGERLLSYPKFSKALKQQLRHRPGDAAPRKVLFLSGDIHDNLWTRWPGFFEATSSGVACWGTSLQNNADVDNWGLITFDEPAGLVTVALNGHPPSYTGTHKVRLSDWQEVT